MRSYSKALGITGAISVTLAAACGGAADAQPVDVSRDGLTAANCAAVMAALGSDVANVTCVVSSDLTTANEETTPQDNSVPGLPPGAFAPRSDRAGIAAGPASRTPITKAVPGLQITGTMADNAGARWLLRLPSDWNGRLVMGVPAATRSEYAGDWVHSDYLVQRGYAYVASNKGHLNSRPGSLDDPKTCHLSPPGVPTHGVLLHFYAADDPQSLQKWFSRTLEATAVGKKLVKAHYGSDATRTYITGLSAGGWVTRVLLERHPEMYDGGLDWEAPSVVPDKGNGILDEFPTGLANFAAYKADGFDTSSKAYKNLQDAKFPPEVFAATGNPFSTRGSFLETHNNNFWNLLQCIFVGVLDPTYSTSAPPPADYSGYDYSTRLAYVKASLQAVSHTGALGKPMISIHGTMDPLALVAGARAYGNTTKKEFHRLYEIQNGSHNDRNPDPPFNFTTITPLAPHFGPVFEHLVAWVENQVEPPASQCVPRGETIVNDAKRTKNCKNLHE